MLLYTISDYIPMKCLYNGTRNQQIPLIIYGDRLTVAGIRGAATLCSSDLNEMIKQLKDL